METSQSAQHQFIGGFGLTSLQKAIARGMFELRMSLSLMRLTNVLLSSLRLFSLIVFTFGIGHIVGQS